MTISVFGSVMQTEPDEVYHDHGVTVDQWLSDQAEDYRPGPRQPVSCTKNGEVIEPSRWAESVIGPDDDVEIHVIPHGDMLDIVFPFWTGTVNPAISAGFDAFMPDMPGQSGSGQQGSDLAPAEARANTARLMQTVPDLLGRHRVYPDYLTQPRRYYSSPRNQVLNLMLSVGVGSYDVDPDSIKIGETPLNEIEGVTYQLIEPGQDISTIDNHENWFHSPEVGATRSSAGLRLKGVTASEQSYDGSATASGATLSGVTVGEYWAPGVYGTIIMRHNVTVTAADQPEDPVIFTGSFQHLEQGISVAIQSPAVPEGGYQVATLNAAKTEMTLNDSNGNPVTVTTADLGAWPMSIDRIGTRYKITAVGSNSVTVERELSFGGTDPFWTGNLPQGSLDVDIQWNADGMVANRAGPFTVVPEGEIADRFEVDIFAPQGLGIIDGENIDPRTREVRIEWREVGTSIWSERIESMTGSTRDQLGWTFVVDMTVPKRIEVRLSRIGEESVETTSLDRLELAAIRSRLPAPTSYAGITTLAVSITGSDQLSSRSENRVNLVATRKLQTRSSGSWTAPQPTRDIAAAFAYIAKSVGYTDDDLDLAELDRLDGIWKARGDTFDYVFGETTVKDALDKVLRAGMAELTLAGGVLTPARDEPRTTFEQAYSPANMTSPLTRSFTSNRVDDSDGVEVEYTSDTTWTKETVRCLLPVDQAIKLDKIKLDGVTDRTRAWRIGMRRRRAQRYRRWSYSFETELDALNSNYLSYVPLVDDVPGYGKAAIMQAIEPYSGGGTVVTVSEPMEWIAGEDHVVAYRNEAGDLVGPFAATPGDTPYQIVAPIPQPWPDLTARQEPPHVFFGTTDRWTFPALIQEISPSGDDRCRVQAVNYDARVYADDDNTAPA